MSGLMLRAIIAGVLAFHGIGQAMGIIPAMRLSIFQGKDWGWLQNWNSHSWLLTPLLGDAATRVISIVLFSVPCIGFLGAALALMSWGIPHEFWRPLSLVSAGVSFVALALYWNALIFIFPHKVGYIAVNMATLIGLLAINWPTEIDLGY